MVLRAGRRPLARLRQPTADPLSQILPNLDLDISIEAGGERLEQAPALRHERRRQRRETRDKFVFHLDLSSRLKPVQTFGRAGGPKSAKPLASPDDLDRSDIFLFVVAELAYAGNGAAWRLPRGRHALVPIDFASVTPLGGCFVGVGAALMLDLIDFGKVTERCSL